MAYTIHEISQIESIMTEEEKSLYDSLRMNRETYSCIKINSSDDNLEEICRKLLYDMKDRELELLSIVEQRISLKSRLHYRRRDADESVWFNDNEPHTGIAYKIVKNGTIEFYTELSDAQVRLKSEMGITPYKIVDGCEISYIPECMLKYVRENKTYKYSIGDGETLVFNIGSDRPYALVLDYAYEVIYSLSDPIFEVSQYVFGEATEVLGIQCSILEKSL
jgi:hypothetical protein